MTLNGPVSSGDLFVFYGLLKKGASGMPSDINLDAAGEFLTPCQFLGEMYDAGGFPAVVKGNTLCHGVRYRLDDTSIMPALDAFEDVVPHDLKYSLYLRIQIPILTKEGKSSGETAWIYWYNQPVTGFDKVEEGNWPLDAGKTRK